jgi:multidrug resistance efflux pump
MASESRLPSLSVVLGVLLLAAAIAIPAYLVMRPTPPPPDTGISLGDLDVVCNGRVDVDGTSFTLEPSQPGRVVQLFVKEGTPLAKGAKILQLDDEPYQSAVKEATTALRGIDVEIEAAEYRQQRHPDQVALQEKKLEATRAELAAGEKQLEQLREKAKLTSQVTKVDVEAFEAKLKSANILLEAEKLQLDQLRKLDTGLEIKGLKIKKEAAQIALQRAEKAVSDCVLLAPVAGVVLRLQTSVGANLAPGLPFPTILFAPNSQLIVRAEVDQSGLGRVKEGMKASVRDDSQSDSPTWTGKVRTIAGWVAQKRSILLEPGEINDVRTTEVIVELDPSKDLLRIGQRMLVRISKAN